MKLTKMLKKWTAAFLTLSLLTAGAAACVNADDADDAEDIVEINMYGLGFFGDGGLQEVEDAINEISEAEIGVHVNYHLMDVQTYMSQLSLMVAGGEPIDLMLAAGLPAIGFTSLQGQNQLLDITDILPEEAPALYELMEEYLPAMTVNGRLYGVPCYRIYNSSYYIMMRKDVLEELGLVEEAEAIDSWSAYEELLLKVKDAQDQLPEELKTSAMICNGDTAGGVMSGRGANFGADAFADNYGFDSLGDNTRVVCVNDDDTVVNFYESDDYRAMIDRVNRWYDEGLVYKDAATDQQGTDLLMQAGASFSGITISEVGVQQVKENAIGHPLTIVKICDTPIVSANGFDWGYVVPVTSQEPEAAVKFMELMYTNPDIENLFVYGIEGRDYEVVDGEAVLKADRLYQNSDFFLGNQFNAYPAQGSGADFRETSLAQMKDAEISKYYGCVVNTEPISVDLTSITALYNQYKPAIESGSAPEGTLDTYISELKTAGVDNVVAFYQENLDAWMAQNAE